MNEENLSIIISQKRDIIKLEEYVDAGFKYICECGKRDHRKITFTGIGVGIMAIVLYEHRLKIKKLEKRVKELEEASGETTLAEDKNEDRLEKVPME